MNAEPASPCVGVCRYDERRGLCTGCLRTLAEISCWPAATAAQKAAILARVAARGRAATPDARQEPG